MTDPEERTPGPDDTAAFQRFYASGPAEERQDRGILYRLLVGWWRNKN
jgi:hypothetical protein